MPTDEKVPFNPNKPGTLLAETLRLLDADERNLTELHNDTGLPLYWLRSLRSGEVIDPGVNRIQHLYEHLSGIKINVLF